MTLIAALEGVFFIVPTLETLDFCCMFGYTSLASRRGLAHLTNLPAVARWSPQRGMWPMVSANVTGCVSPPSQCMVRPRLLPTARMPEMPEMSQPALTSEFPAFPAFPPTSLGPEPRVDDPPPRRPAGTLAGLGDFPEPPRLFEPVDQFLRLIGV